MRSGNFRITKHSKEYWFAKVYRPRVRGVEVDNYAVRLFHRGSEKRLSLGTPNREAAADLARDMFVYLSANGWAAFLAKYRNPESAASNEGSSSTARFPNDRKSITVGEYLAAVRTESDLTHKTIADYEGCLRFIVSEIMEVGKGKTRHQYDRYRGGHKAWVAALDETPIDVITADKIRVWKKDYVNRAGRDEVARRRRVVTVNSYLRRARALFAKKIKLKSVTVTRSPFEGVALEKRTDTKFYGAGVDPVTLLRAAINELAEDRTEELKAFLLGLTLGLRRREVDLLEWSSFDFLAGTLRIQPTKWYQLKTNESAAELPVEPEILELFRGWRAHAPSEFVLESDRPPRSLDYEYYRCEATFKRLVEWLRSKGVQGNKPFHALRKMYGSALADLHGLAVASSGLRHADLRTTAGFYVDRRVRATPGFGQAISGADVLPAVDASIPSSPNVPRATAQLPKL
jgi:integrase